MCGRYTLTDPGAELLRHFQLSMLPPDYRPRYNIAPTQTVVAILAGGAGRRAGNLRWGLIPSWAKDPAVGNRMINARAETVAAKPSFGTALRRRRCLIPADGFYEWQRSNGRKQPVRFVAADGGLFAFAGLWESWRPAEGEAVHTCTIITTAANDFVRSVHDRMPVILAPEDYDLWLDREIEEPAAVLPLLRGAPDNSLRKYNVSSVVNSARNEAPECIKPLAE